MFDNFLSEFSSQNALQKRVRSKGFILKIQKNNSFRIETETESNCVNNFNNLISANRKSNEKIGPKNSGLFTVAKYPVYPDRNELHNHFFPLPHSLGGLTSQANLTAQPRQRLQRENVLGGAVVSCLKSCQHSARRRAGMK